MTEENITNIRHYQNKIVKIWNELELRQALERKITQQETENLGVNLLTYLFREFFENHPDIEGLAFHQGVEYNDQEYEFSRSDIEFVNYPHAAYPHARVEPHEEWLRQNEIFNEATSLLVLAEHAGQDVLKLAFGLADIRITPQFVEVTTRDE